MFIVQILGIRDVTTSNVTTKRHYDSEVRFAMVYQLSLRASSSRVAGAWALRWQQRTVRRIAVDGVFNYASALLNDGLLLLEFCDAIREGDGKRILRCWRAMLIYFQHARHSNYAKEAILPCRNSVIALTWSLVAAAYPRSRQACLMASLTRSNATPFAFIQDIHDCHTVTYNEVDDVYTFR